MLLMIGSTRLSALSVALADDDTSSSPWATPSRSLSLANGRSVTTTGQPRGVATFTTETK